MKTFLFQVSHTHYIFIRMEICQNEKIKWNLNYSGGNTMTISKNGLSYTYTYIGKGYNYDSIQKHPLVVAAAR